jgi:protein SCO1
VLGYYRCPNLCGVVMQDVLSAAQSVALPPQAYRVLAVSIDPGENPHLAAQKRDSYRRALAGGTGRLERRSDARAGEPANPTGGGAVRLDLLTGSDLAIKRLADAAGFRFAHDPRRGYLHPAGFIVATPDGTISRYFMGVHTEARDLRLALVQASSGEVGTLSDRIALVCSHFDPATGRYTGMALTLVRAGTLATLALLAALAIARMRARSRP